MVTVKAPSLLLPLFLGRLPPGGDPSCTCLGAGQGELPLMVTIPPFLPFYTLTMGGFLPPPFPSLLLHLFSLGGLPTTAYYLGQGGQGRHVPGIILRLGLEGWACAGGAVPNHS